MRRWLRSGTQSLIILIVTTWLNMAGVSSAFAQRPNIIFAFADDWGRYASVYGKLEPGGINDVVQTPNFDRLASSGILFNRAFVNSPSCTPCRSSLLSGQYFWRTGRGAILSGAVWDSAIPSFPLLLQRSGYHIGHTAKVWSPGTPANAPYGATQTAYNSGGSRFNNFSEALDDATDVPKTREELLSEVRSNFQSFLAKRPDMTPFCYWWGPTTTHRKWVRGSGAKFWKLNPDDLKGKMPSRFPDVPEVREDVCDYLGEVQALDAGLGELLAELERTGEIDNTIVIVSGDHGIPGMPAGKCNLYDLGTRVSLAISWPARIKAQRVVDDFVCLPDLAPTILEAAGEVIPAVMTGRSLMPVLMSAASGQVDSTRDFVVTGRERHVAVARTDRLPYPQRAIRTADFLYIRNFHPERWPMGTAPGFGGEESAMPDHETLTNATYSAFADMDASPTKAWLIEEGLRDPEYRPFFNAAFALRPAEELYDLRKDPNQMLNVAATEEYSAFRKELADRLMQVLTSTNDPRVGDGTSVFDLPPFTGDDENAGAKKAKRR